MKSILIFFKDKIIIFIKTNKNCLKIIFFITILISIFIYIIPKICLKNIISDYNLETISKIITPIITIFITIIFWFFQRAYNQNKLTSEVIDEYSHEDMRTAIIYITDIVKSIECEIENEDLDNKDKNKKMKIIIAYNEFYINKNKILIIKKKEYTWDELEFSRRLIALYYLKLNTLCEKNLINLKILKKFWNPISLSYLSNSVITMEYFNPYITRGLNPLYSKETHLINFYNYFIDFKHRKYKIDKKKLQQIYKEYINNEFDNSLISEVKNLIKVKKNIINN